jgi:hypothetical protein
MADMRAWTVAALISITSVLMPSAATASDWPWKFVDLSYPAEALAAGVTGTVVVRVLPDSSGSVVEAEPLSGPAALRPAVVANARQWRLGPARPPGPDFLVYRFEIDEALCNDDSRSLFRLVHRNMASITACSVRGRQSVRTSPDELPVASFGTVPPYPPRAKKSRVVGVVILELSIATNDVVTDVRVLSGEPLLSETAVAHAKTWRVWTTSGRRRLVVYEFAFDKNLCTPEDFDYRAFGQVSSAHVRLSVCEWGHLDDSGEDRE